MPPKSPPDTEAPLVGFVNIAEALRTSPRQVLVWATRPRDPLRLISYHGVPRIAPSCLSAWSDRHCEKIGLRRVRGWHQIARFVEMSRLAAIRASEAPIDPLPVQHPKGPGGGHAMVWAYESALRDWRDARMLPYLVHRRVRVGRWASVDPSAIGSATGAAMDD